MTAIHPPINKVVSNLSPPLGCGAVVDCDQSLSLSSGEEFKLTTPMFLPKTLIAFP